MIKERGPGSAPWQPSRRQVALGRAALLGAALVLLLVLFIRARAASPFSHQAHLAAGVACENCHPSVREEPFAGRPGSETCRMCHRDDRTGTRLVHAVQTLPEHVFFSHRRHVKVARIACAVCHGGLGSTDGIPPRPPVDLSMEFCVACHHAAGASEDCIACHR